MLVVHFPKARFWVNSRTLKRYVLWSWQVSHKEERWHFRRFLRQLWSPTLVFELPQVLSDAFDIARQLGVKPGWVRYPTDSTRLQVFDANGCGICKVLLPNVYSNSLDFELAARRRVGKLAPTIISVSHEANAYVEEWIAVTGQRYSSDLLERALLRLQDALYDIEWIGQDQFLIELQKWGTLSDKVLQAVHSAYANLGNTDRVPWSVVHGDLVEQNLLLNQANEMILIDWEYTRGCIATYDCWLYQYDHERVLGSVDAPVFCQRFSACLKGLAGINAGDLCPCSMHVLHLVERIHYLAHVSPHTTHVIRQMMLSDMRNACKELARGAQAS